MPFIFIGVALTSTSFYWMYPSWYGWDDDGDDDDV